jgi:hypothetical protein
VTSVAGPLRTVATNSGPGDHAEKMTVGLAQRLIWDEVVSQEDVDRALHLHVTLRAPFLKALVDERPEAIERLEAELGRPAAGAATLTPDAELAGILPPGLTTMLLALPIAKSPDSKAVRFAVADPSDPHVLAELVYHVGGPVELVAAPLRTLLALLAPRRFPPESRAGSLPPSSPRPPAPSAISTSRIKPLTSSEARDPRPSSPPIPLVRVTENTSAPTTVKGVAPQATGDSFASKVVVPPRKGAVVAEPIINLTRSKPMNEAPSSPTTSIGPMSPPPAEPNAGSSPEASTKGGTVPLDIVLEAFDRAASPDDVVRSLVEGLSSVARRAIVLATRGKVFEGRDATDEASRQTLKKLVISSDRPSVLVTAVQTGHYVGPLPQTLVHQELAEIFGDLGDEIAVGVVNVSGRAALVYVMGGLETTYLATRRSDQLAEAAARALERIVRQRKK